MNTRLSDLARGTVIYGLGEVLSRTLSFVLLPVLTRYLSPAEYGALAILAALSVFVTPVFSLGLGASIAPTYFDGNDVRRKHDTINTAATILTGSAVVLMGLGLAFSRPASRLLFQGEDFAPLLLISLATTAFTIVVTPIRQFYQFEHRARAYALLSAATILAQGVFTIVGVIVLRRGMRGMLEAGLAGQALGLVLFALPIAGWLRPRVKGGIARDILRVGLPLIPAFGCTWILQQSSKYLLQWSHGLDAVGVYSIGLSLGATVSIVVGAFQSAWVPYFMSFADKPGESRIVFGRILTYYAMTMGGLSLALFASARVIVLVMTAPSYHGAWVVVGLTAMAQVLAGAASVLLPGMYIAKEVQFVGLLQGVAGVIGVVLGWFAVRGGGLVGAAVALNVGYAALIVLQFAWNARRRYRPVDYEWGRLMRFAVVFGLFAAASSWPRNFRPVEEGGFAVLLLAALPVVLYTQLSADERTLLWRLPRRFLGGRVGDAPLQS